MERNGSKFLAILALMILMVAAVSARELQAASGDCEKHCDAECARSDGAPVCKAICIKICEIPPTKISKAVKDCSLGCTASICYQFTKDIEAMKGCVGACTESCNKFQASSSP